eukprot:scaffold2114_cov253-Pinguiococcus_pyrenoidosus.AAC.9
MNLASLASILHATARTDVQRQRNAQRLGLLDCRERHSLGQEDTRMLHPVHLDKEIAGVGLVVQRLVSVPATVSP